MGISEYVASLTSLKLERDWCVKRETGGEGGWSRVSRRRIVKDEVREVEI